MRPLLSLLKLDGWAATRRSSRYERQLPIRGFFMRLTLIPPSDLTLEQCSVYEDMKAGISAKYSAFTTMRDDGTILGPWSAWLHEPELGSAIWGVTKAMTRFRRRKF